MYIHWHKMPAKWLDLNIFGKICQPVLDGDPVGRLPQFKLYSTDEATMILIKNSHALILWLLMGIYLP